MLFLVRGTHESEQENLARTQGQQTLTGTKGALSSATTVTLSHSCHHMVTTPQHTQYLLSCEGDHV